MINFSKLPDHIKENIFSKLQITDLYEVSVVSEEWFWITTKTYNGILAEDDHLIRSLLDLYNRKMRLSPPLMWFNMVKYANFRGVRLRFQAIPPSYLENFIGSKMRIFALYLESDFIDEETEANPGTESMQTKLDDILKYFPHLSKLSMKDVSVDPKCLQIPKGIKKLRLSEVKVNGVAWSRLFEDPESIQSLELQNCEGLTYDHVVLKNLKSLSMHFEESLNVHQMKSVLDLIRGSKCLRSVELTGAIITKEWFNLFSKNIQNISLEDIYIEKQLLTELGSDGCYERRIMSFLCSDLRTVKRFTLAYISSEFDEGVEENAQHPVIEYSAVYTCEPQLMQETLLLFLDSTLSRQVQTITTSDVGPALRDLHIRYRMGTDVKTHLFTHCVPGSVKKFTLMLDGEFENISMTQLCEQPQNLEELHFHSPDVTTSLSFQRDCFTLCTQMKILDVSHVNREGLQNLLHQCVLLEKLILIKPEEGCFTDLSPTCISKSIREVKLHLCDARLEDVLNIFPNLEVLDLSLHLTLPRSVPTDIARLKFFSCFFDESLFVIRDNNTNIVFVMDSIDLPFKLFHSNFDWSCCSFKLAQNALFIKEFYASFRCVYCSGCPARFLQACHVKVITDVKEFANKLTDSSGH